MSVFLATLSMSFSTFSTFTFLAFILGLRRKGMPTIPGLPTRPCFYDIDLDPETEQIPISPTEPALNEI
ncbi:hypothetical protein CRUP_019764 [Coryphaenoides rupestris]|nr:hypothetical protein CRUP_019764 [Coryphaenoides rupestris]